MSDDGQPSPENPDRNAGGEQSHGRLEESRAWNIPAYLLAGVLGFGGLGWIVDHVLATGFFVVIGILGGMALAVYYVWFRYGTP